MLPAIMLRWMVLFVDRDDDVIALFRALPRRFFKPTAVVPAAASAVVLADLPMQRRVVVPALVLEGGATRYGRVSANLTVTPAVAEAQCPEGALLQVRLDMHGRGYVDKTNGLTVEMRLRAARGGCSENRTLLAATVSSGIGGHNVTVDRATETVKLHLASALGRGAFFFQVHATFAASGQ
jgi:hypothetical protein